MESLTYKEMDDLVNFVDEKWFVIAGYFGQKNINLPVHKKDFLSFVIGYYHILRTLQNIINQSNQEIGVA